MPQINLREDKKLLREILNKKNLAILSYLTNYEDHGIRSIAAGVKGINRESARGQLIKLRRAGVLRVATSARGRRPRTYRITEKASIILEALC